MSEILNDWASSIVPWLSDHGLRILGILVGAYLVHLVSKRAIERLVRLAIIPDNHITPDAEKRREDTLIRIFNWTIKILLLIVVVMMILQEAGVSIGPMLAGAGIVGLAVGFGGQYLIRDIITGFFIILENQYRIGDVVRFNETGGVVEDISLRVTTLRDLDGTVHHVPHGEIKQVSNLSKNFSRINLNIGIAYQSDLEKVITIINQVGDELAKDPHWGEFIIKPPKFLRVEDFSDTSVVVKILGETQPLKQWEVTGELRKRIKMAFDREGIEMPYTQKIIYQVNKENP